MPWKRDWIVSTGTPNTAVISVPAKSATMVPGTVVFRTRQAISTARLASDSTVAAHDTVWRLDASTVMRRANSPGIPATASPKKSRICVLAMMMAMPLVKPTTTGRGMKLMALPMPVAPSRTSITPPIIVHMKRPATPCCATMLETTTTKAPVGPPIWTIDPPSAEIRKPVTIAQ